MAVTLEENIIVTKLKLYDGFARFFQFQSKSLFLKIKIITAYY